MLRTRFEWAVLIVVTTLLGGAWIVVSRDAAAESRPTTLAEAPIVGHLAPDFTLADSAGQPVALNDYVNLAEGSGQPMVLNFWATWCAPCRIEMPHLQNANRKYNGRAAIVGINQGESAEMVSDFGNEFDISYPLLVDADNSVSRLYNVTGMPTTVFIDASGVVREVVIGIVSQAVLEERIERMLE